MRTDEWQYIHEVGRIVNEQTGRSDGAYLAELLVKDMTLNPSGTAEWGAEYAIKVVKGERVAPIGWMR